MKNEASRLPSRKWSIVALGTAGMATVTLSYLLAIAVALGCMALPYVMFVLYPIENGSLLVWRLLLSAFGVVAGFTILRSLIPQKEDLKINGVPIDLKQEKRLAGEIESISTAMREPMPSEVYLLGDANAFVSESNGFLGMGKRRVMGLGLPLLEMLSIAQFRAVLAHEFGHYYAGDTRLGPWVYNTRKSMARAYENLGSKSEVLKFLRRWAVVYAVFMVLMSAMRVYWNIFMRVTQAISRQQEFRSDELACHIAGSQGLIEGLEKIRKCQSALGSYWNSVVLPVAMSGFQPTLAEGFGLFMHAPHIEKATDEFLRQQSTIERPSPLDTHPPLAKRIERAKLYNLPGPEAGEVADSSLPMTSLIDGLPALEASLLKKIVPALAAKELAPLEWESAGSEVYVPLWRKEVTAFQSRLAGNTLGNLPAVVADPRPIAGLVENPKNGRLSDQQREARALNIVFIAVALSLVDHGWSVRSQPGVFYFDRGEKSLDPGELIGDMKSGKMTAEGWAAFRAENGIGEWPLVPLEALQAGQQ
jgi:heat shock protein HtpX